MCDKKQKYGVLGWLSWVRDSDHDLTVHRTKPHSDSVLSEDSTWTLFLSAPLPTHILLTHINHWKKETKQQRERNRQPVIYRYWSSGNP